MPNAGWRNPGARTLVAALVLLAHLGGYVLFARFERPSVAIARKEGDSILIEIDLGLPPPPSPELQIEPPAMRLPPVALELPRITGLDEPAASADWLADGARAAAEPGTPGGPAVRSFGTPERPPTKAHEKSFGWDKNHTRRVEVIAGVGVRIRLNDHCDLVVSLIVMAGCSLGTVPARGDLFDGMNAPVEMGDWNDSSTPTP
jgi:hypothetical protein